MLSPASRRAFSFLLVVALALTSFAQSRPKRQQNPNPPKPPVTEPDKVPQETDEVETLAGG